MERYAEYQNFIRIYQMQHGYMQPPTYTEWLYNFNNGSSVTNFNNVNSYSVSNFPHTYSTVVPSASKQHAAVANCNKTVMYRGIWTESEENVLVRTWAENFEQLETVSKNEAWVKILSAVLKVGDKTLKQCKDKIRNLRDQYKEAKDKNKATGESFHKSAHFETFDKVLGSRDALTMPHLMQVGITSSKNVGITSSKNVSNSSSTDFGITNRTNVGIANSKNIQTPSRLDLESRLLKSGKKRKFSSKEKKEDLKNFLNESQKRHEEYMSDLMKAENVRLINAEKEERQKDRDLLRELFKKD